MASAEELMQAATKEAGLDDVGDNRFVEGLERYLDALAKDAELSPLGVGAVSAEVQQLLVNRLRFERDLVAHPEILDEQVRAPLFILGLPRTATTKLQQVLAEDPGVLKLPYWRILNVAPFPDSVGVEPDPRIAFSDQAVAAATEAMPDFLIAHPAQTHAPEEESFIMRMTFESEANAAFDFVPSYWEWVRQQPQEYTYQYLRRLLQYVQWQCGGGSGRPWVLKTPVHLARLDALIGVFPDATVVQCHRDPCVTVPSMLRLYEVIWRGRGNQVDLGDIRVYSDVWADQMQINMRLREELASQLNVVDVQYSDIVDDVLSVSRAVFEAWGRRLEPAVEQAISGWDVKHPQHRFGKHEYSLERYGLTEAGIKQQFGDYIERFNLTR